MSSHSDDFMVQNLKKVEECKLASLNSVAYKRGVPSALSCKCLLEDCGKVISRPRDLLMHIKAAHKLEHLWWCYACDLFFPRVSDLERHGFYVHQIPEWSNTSLTTKEYTLKEQPPRFNAKKYFQGLTKADKVTAPYTKVAKNIVKKGEIN